MFGKHKIAENARLIGSTNVVHLETPIKSVNDMNDYAVIRLPNGLTAILIGDSSKEGRSDQVYVGSTTANGKETEDDGNSIEKDVHGSQRPKRSNKVAAAALCVQVGSFSDSPEIQGLAHFLEHMVFMGSEKFPKENSFDSYITSHGGESNACTDGEVTTFNFDCSENRFEGALDRFAQFFIAPLMKREAMTRERENIESEFQNFLLAEDDCRKEQLLTSLAKKDNPCRIFSWGNMETLSDNVTDADLYEAVHRFRTRHYSAHRMTLAVQCRSPIAVLESYVVKYFSDIPNNGMPAVDLTRHVLAFDTPEFTCFYRVKPVADVCVLEFTWALPPLLADYKSKPQEYLVALLRHEGNGSLMSYLRKRLWALDIEVSTGDSDLYLNTMYTLLTVSLGLTSQGLAHLKEVGAAVFGYLKMLRESGPSETFHKEMQMIMDTQFRYEDEQEPFDAVEGLAWNLMMYPSKDCITGSELLWEFNPLRIGECLELMKPSTVNVMLLDDDAVFDQEEHWFKTAYSVCPIADDWLDCWTSVQVDASFHMPDPNVFMPTDFTLLSTISPVSPNPILVLSTDTVELWHLLDTKYRLPVGRHYYYFVTPFSTASTQSQTLMDLYVSVLDHMLTEELYPANEADYSVTLTVCRRGIEIKASGYNHKLGLVLKLVINRMSKLEATLSEELFSPIKENMKKFYYNNFIRPKSLAHEIQHSILFKHHRTFMEKHEAIFMLTLQDLKDFSRSFFKDVFIYGLVQGDICVKDAVDTCNYITSTLLCGKLSSGSQPESRVTQIPLGRKCLRVKSFNTNDTNSVVCHYYQAGYLTMKDSCVLTLLLYMMEEPLFDVLRTRLQLGYSVGCKEENYTGVKGFSIVVNYQADRNSADVVDERVENFLKDFNKHLKHISNEDLQEVKLSLRESKRLSNLSLPEEADYNWREIVAQEYRYDRHLEEAELIEHISKKELLNCLKRHTSAASGARRFSVQVVGSGDGSGVTESKRTRAKRSWFRNSSDSMLNSHSQLQDNADSTSRTRAGKCEAPERYSVEIISNSTSTEKNYYISDMKEFKCSLQLYPQRVLINMHHKYLLS